MNLEKKKHFMAANKIIKTFQYLLLSHSCSIFSISFTLFLFFVLCLFCLRQLWKFFEKHCTLRHMLNYMSNDKDISATNLCPKCPKCREKTKISSERKWNNIVANCRNHVTWTRRRCLSILNLNGFDFHYLQLHGISK